MRLSSRVSKINPSETLAITAKANALKVQGRDVIRRDINITSLKYLAIEDMIAAIGLPAEQLCLHCWQGKSRV